MGIIEPHRVVKRTERAKDVKYLMENDPFSLSGHYVVIFFFLL
jgi:hypothetical protein